MYAFAIATATIEAEQLLAKHGRNELPEKNVSKWVIFGQLLIQPMPLMIWLAALIELCIANFLGTYTSHYITSHHITSYHGAHTYAHTYIHLIVCIHLSMYTNFILLSFIYRYGHFTVHSVRQCLHRILRNYKGSRCRECPEELA